MQLIKLLENFVLSSQHTNEIFATIATEFPRQWDEYIDESHVKGGGTMITSHAK